MSKTRKYVMLSTIITALCLTFIVVGSKPAQAKTYYTTNYSITSAFEDFEALSSNGLMTVHITINFTDYYTGTMRLGLTNSYSVDYNVLMYNAKLSAKSTSYFTIVFDQVKNIDIYLVLKAADYFGSIGTTASAVSNYFVGNWSTLFDINTVNNVSITVDNPVEEITDGISNIYTDIEVLKGYVNLLLENSNNIESDVDSINSQLITLVNSIDNFQTYDVKTYQYSAFLIFENVADLQYNSDLALPVYHLPARSTYGLDEFFRVGAGENMYFIYYMKTSYYNTFNYITNNNNNGYRTSRWVLEAGWRLYYDNFTNPTGSTMYYTPINSVGYDIVPIYYGPEYAMPDEVKQLIGFSTKSESLLNRILNATTSGIDSIISALNNLNITSDDDTEINNYVTANDNSITTITNNHETVNNITNDFNLDFGTADNSITLDLDTLPDLTNTATFWNGKAGDLDVELGDFHYPIWLGFVLLAIMAMIGV